MGYIFLGVIFDAPGLDDATTPDAAEKGLGAGDAANAKGLGTGTVEIFSAVKLSTALGADVPFAARLDAA